MIIKKVEMLFVVHTEYNSMLSKQHGYIITVTLQLLYGIMLFNIVGHKIDGHCESWNCLMQKLRGDRLAPSLHHTLGQDGFYGDVKIMHIQLLFSHFIRS